MSKLDELIRELCPDGVIYKPFYEVADYIRGVTYGKGKEVNDGKGGYKLLRANNITLSSNTLNFDDVKIIDFSVKVKPVQMLKKGDILICAGSGSKEHIGKVAFVFEDIDYTFGGFMGVIRVSKIVLPRFMFHMLTGKLFKEHLLKVSGASSSTINNINNDTWKNFLLPVPPLPVQEEIVRILDSFTALTVELTDMLTAELTARKKQYEHYRNTLLTFEDSVPFVTLPDISLNCDRQRKPVTKGNREAGKYPYYGASGIVDYVADYIFDGDYLLVSEDGANLVARSTPIAFSISGQNWVNNHAHVLQFDSYEVRKYVEIYLNSIDLSKYISGGAQPKLNQENLNKIPIPMPSFERVAQIVDILTRFDTLCSDINSGLPAEIEARQKQYEYYRDKLLTFPVKQ